MFVSVIIPVYNDNKRLRICLEALEAQTYPRDSFEVIVIDNGSEEVVADVTQDFPDVLLLLEKSIGSYAARNTGVAVAKGDMLAFTDADCIPMANWLSKGVDFLSKQPDKVLGGSVALFAKNPEQPNIVEQYELLFGFPVERFVAEKHFVPTCNLMVLRHIFDKVGTFNTHLQSGGDVEWGKRAHSLGIPIHYREEVAIQHPARFTLKSLLLRHHRIVFGEAQRLRQQSRLPLLLSAWWVSFLKNLFILPSPRIWKKVLSSSLDSQNKISILGFVIFWRICTLGLRIRALFPAYRKRFD